MSIAQLINYEGPKDVLVWKSDVTDFNTGTQLIVHESQETIFFKDGVALDLFGAGRHELSTSNLPLLRKIYEKITSNPTTFHTEIYYFNKTVSAEILWGTSSPIQTEDPKYGILIDVRSFGSYKVQIEDSRKFLVKTLGTIKQFKTEEIQEYFRTEMMSKVKVALATAISQGRISILDITMHQEELENLVKQKLTPVFSEYGLSIKQFIISTIKAIDDDLKKLREVKEKNVETIVGASARRQAMDILNTNYREQESFEVMKEAAKNQAPGGLTGIGVGLGLAPKMQEVMSNNLDKKEEDFKVCKECGEKNNKNAKFCLSCGHKFEENICKKCGAKLAENAKFCGECGQKVSTTVKCSSCGKEYPAGTKFCPECGEKL